MSLQVDTARSFVSLLCVATPAPPVCCDSPLCCDAGHVPMLKFTSDIVQRIELFTGTVCAVPVGKCSESPS